MFVLSSRPLLEAAILEEARKVLENDALEFYAPEEYLLSEQWGQFPNGQTRKTLLTPDNLLFLPSKCTKLLGDGGLLCRNKNRVMALVGPTRTGKSEFLERRLVPLLMLEEGRTREVAIVNGNYITDDFKRIPTGQQRIEELFRLFAERLDVDAPDRNIHAFVTKHT